MYTSIISSTVIYSVEPISIINSLNKSLGKGVLNIKNWYLLRENVVNLILRDYARSTKIFRQE